ncbi:NTP transferase domain-containing protein [Vibrio splendidus]
MNLILTMAGRGTRVNKYSLGRPKFTTLVNGISLLERSLSSTSKLKFETIVVVCISEHNNDYDIESQVNKCFKYSSVIMVTLKESTKSQVHSSYIGLEKIDSTKPVLIQNIDTQFLCDEILDITWDKKSTITVPVFESNNPMHSYVNRLNDNSTVVVEGLSKNQSAGTALSGLYGFNNANELKEAIFENLNIYHDESNELRFSTIINYLVSHGYALNTPMLSDCTAFGSDEEIMLYLKSVNTINNKEYG